MSSTDRPSPDARSDLPPEPDGVEGPTCPQCLTLNSPLSHFCEKCGGPLSALSTVGPFEQIHAQGFLLRNITRGKPRLIVVIGSWILFSPLIGGALLELLWVLSVHGRVSHRGVLWLWALWLLALVVGLAVMAIGIILPVRATLLYLHMLEYPELFEEEDEESDDMDNCHTKGDVR